MSDKYVGSPIDYEGRQLLFAYENLKSYLNNYAIPFDENDVEMFKMEFGLPQNAMVSGYHSLGKDYQKVGTFYTLQKILEESYNHLMMSTSFNFANDDWSTKQMHVCFNSLGEHIKFEDGRHVEFPVPHHSDAFLLRLEQWYCIKNNEEFDSMDVDVPEMKLRSMRLG